LHTPKLHDLRPATRAIGDGTKEFSHADAMTGFLNYLATCACKGAFIELKLAAGQHPKLILRPLHDSNQRAPAVAHHDASRRMNCLARHTHRFPPPTRLAKMAAVHAGKCLRPLVPVGNVA
jgi:hypothetical protein